MEGISVAARHTVFNNRSISTVCSNFYDKILIKLLPFVDKLVSFSQSNHFSEVNIFVFFSSSLSLCKRHIRFNKLRCHLIIKKKRMRRKQTILNIPSHVYAKHNTIKPILEMCTKICCHSCLYNAVKHYLSRFT